MRVAPNEDADCVGDAGAANRQWLMDQEALVGISKNCKRIIAKTKGHNIQFNEPKLIVDTVRAGGISATRPGFQTLSRTFAVPKKSASTGWRRF